MRTSKILSIIGFVIAAVAVACFIGWFASRDASKETGQTQAESNSGTRTDAFFKTGPATRTAVEVANMEAAKVKKAAEDAAAAAAASNAVSAQAEEKIDEILGGDLDEDKKAEEMLKYYPKLSPAAQSDVIGHILNLASDEGFAPVGKILVNPKTPEDVADQIMNDLGNRPGSVRMPLLLQVARDKNNPKAAEAKELLEVYIEPDVELGDDWDKWEAATKKYLEENPD